MAEMLDLEPIKPGLSGPESSQRQLNFQKSPSHKKIIPDADPEKLKLFNIDIASFPMVSATLVATPRATLLLNVSHNDQT
jgi:DNA repair protein REV1